MDEPEISQYSLFRFAAEALRPLARLTLDLDEVARRLGLAPEESWDGRGALRVACFVLGGTDFAVSRHGSEPVGTTVWSTRAGPVDPGQRLGILLDALGAGPEEVLNPGVPADLWQGAVRREQSHQLFWERFRKRPGMYTGRVAYGPVASYLGGYDMATGGALLDGFRQWLAVRFRNGGNLHWSALVADEVFPDGLPEGEGSPEQERHAVQELLRLLDEFFEQREPSSC
ncbi:hypothetical protein ACIRVF_19760 [Kitasatospora sp. NPDC101157]|uniref:hypothetical protein n=1 Tax=Kitasatospora sp. NPDC101157 TaxID=3364098 RepID=UPI0037F5F77E